MLSLYATPIEDLRRGDFFKADFRPACAHLAPPTPEALPGCSAARISAQPIPERGILMRRPQRC